jgi:hypothetical protein
MRSMVTRSTCLARYGRSLGFGLALALAGVVGCGDGGSSSDKKDAKPAVMDGPVVDGPATTPDLPITVDTRDALPAVDGADAPITIDTKDAPVVDAPPTAVDGRKRDVPQAETSPIDRGPDNRPADTAPRETQPRPDTRKADAGEVDGGSDDAAIDAEQAG